MSIDTTLEVATVTRSVRWARIAQRTIELLAPSCAAVSMVVGSPITYRQAVLQQRLRAYRDSDEGTTRS